MIGIESRMDQVETIDNEHEINKNLDEFLDGTKMNTENKKAEKILTILEKQLRNKYNANDVDLAYDKINGTYHLIIDGETDIEELTIEDLEYLEGLNNELNILKNDIKELTRKFKDNIEKLGSIRKDLNKLEVADLKHGQLLLDGREINTENQSLREIINKKTLKAENIKDEIISPQEHSTPGLERPEGDIPDVVEEISAPYKESIENVPVDNVIIPSEHSTPGLERPEGDIPDVVEEISAPYKESIENVPVDNVR